MTTFTLDDWIEETKAVARLKGWKDETPYELTKEDCEYIVKALGRKPTREEWADAGYSGVGDAHVGATAETVNYHGKTLTLQQQPYISTDRYDLSRTVYVAHATDHDGNDYEVSWDLIDGREDREDESERCDLNRFTIREL